jgi:group II intron reverse transcriptase/maturase
MEPPGGKTAGPQTLGTVSTKLERIAQLAKEAPAMAFRSLAHHVDMEFMREAYRRTRKDGATGVDGVDAETYEADLEKNLQLLLDRFKAGTYQAPPVRRVHIPKGDGRTRPIGIPTFEDKILQRVVATLLGAVYEQDFLDCSFGFRPKRSAHQALEILWQELMDMGGGWVLDVDIKGFFDTIEPRHLRAFLDQRVIDGVLRRAIDKWLKAGVQEDGALTYPETGTPQGGVISPLLANIYLHVVLDTWLCQQVRPSLRGRIALVRYADDFVIVCAREEDARTIMAMLPERFGTYGLTLHPEKTRLVPFRRPARDSQRRPPTDGTSTSGSFDLLGFTHFWARSRKGNWVVKRKTAAKRFSRALRSIAVWCRRNLHEPIAEQHRTLVKKLRGHCEYYGITGNSGALSSFRHFLLRIWRRALDRRSHTANMTWERFNRLLEILPMPAAIAVHSAYRLAVNP